jgi:RimJ/RimL family protein N-acetyltransferase
VAREKRYLALTEAPPFEKALEFVEGNIAKGNPQFVALVDGVVVGWCDVSRHERPAYAHSGMLGMGVVAEHRGKGIGAALMQATLERARALGFERIELTVYEGNERARALYARFGFVDEGLKRNAVKFDGVARNAHAMALVYDPAPRGTP